ncbi:hypothetical protein HDU76_001600 [Blyttiomyces sp. JEL0837]|nr:hypothetical protein HDU76_001600 [Blyttiomyces sp. JEL0837]
MVLYKIVIHTCKSDVVACKSSSHSKDAICDYSHRDYSSPRKVTVTYPCCVSILPIEETIFYNESDGRPKELSGIILLVMMAFQNDSKPNKAELSLQEIKNKLVARPGSFPTLDNQVISPTSVPIRCLTSSHIRLELKGKDTTIAFATNSTGGETIKPVTVDSLEFALWGAEVLENQELKNGFDMFLANVKAAEKELLGKDVVVADIAGVGMKMDQLSFKKVVEKSCESVVRGADDDCSEFDGSEFRNEK